MAIEQQGTREAILEQAILAIEEGGEASVRVAVIAANVGVAVTAIYHHFGSRDGLVESALAERYLRSIMNLQPRTSEFLESISTREEFEAGLKILVDELAQPVRYAQRMIRVQVVAGSAGRPGLMEKVKEMQLFAVRQQAGLYRIAQEKGFISASLDLEAFASMLTCLVFGRVLQDMVVGEIDDQAFNELMLKALRGMID